MMNAIKTSYCFFTHQLGHDVRQAFLGGCDVFMDKTLQGSLKTVEECQVWVQGFTDCVADDQVRVQKNVLHSGLKITCKISTFRWNNWSKINLPQ